MVYIDDSVLYTTHPKHLIYYNNNNTNNEYKESTYISNHKSFILINKKKSNNNVLIDNNINTTINLFISSNYKINDNNHKNRKTSLNLFKDYHEKQFNSLSFDSNIHYNKNYINNDKKFKNKLNHYGNDKISCKRRSSSSSCISALLDQELNNNTNNNITKYYNEQDLFNLDDVIDKYIPDNASSYDSVHLEEVQDKNSNNNLSNCPSSSNNNLTDTTKCNKDSIHLKENDKSSRSSLATTSSSTSSFPECINGPEDNVINNTGKFEIEDHLLIDLKKEILCEELEEFILSDKKVLRFPDYFDEQDNLLLKEKCMDLSLGFQFIESKGSIVYKKNNLHRANVSNNDIFVNIPELASKGKESFLSNIGLRRFDSAGGKRRNMLWEIASNNDNNHIKKVGENDGVYAVQSPNDNNVLAMFKPIGEEHFVREGLICGEGAIREEAAYILDNNFAGVPATAVAQLYHSNKKKEGSVQKYLKSDKGSLEDFGMPYDLNEACKLVKAEEIHQIGILDIRIFNTDRHPGNILLIGDTKPYHLAPIDHGCILPSWFHLEEARFDWLEYPQSKIPFTLKEIEYIKNLNEDKDADILRSLNIRPECIITLIICTKILKLAAIQYNKNLHWIGNFIQRSGCMDKISNLENLILITCKECNIPFYFNNNKYNEPTGFIQLGIISRRLPKLFYEKMEKNFIHYYINNK